jgi:hypothetical protein
VLHQLGDDDDEDGDLAPEDSLAVGIGKFNRKPDRCVS